MSQAHLYIGDVFEVLATIPDGSVDLVLTSPPFLALRSYLPADHPDKAKEIGSEPTPAAFIDTLLALTAEWRRVLAPHGSICIELGDTYSGSGGAGGDYSPGGLREGQERFDGPRPQRKRTRSPIQPNGAGWPLDKSLCGIPHLYHLSLAYGRNLLTGQPSPAGQWRVRNVVAWCRPNPPVGALGDKFRPGTSYMTIACVARDRYFDLDAVRTPFTGHGYTPGHRRQVKPENSMSNRANGLDKRIDTHDGAPPLDHWWHDDVFEQDAWLISTQPYKGSHYATWPEALITRPIEAMCPRKVCTTCGKPSERIVEPDAEAQVFNRGRREGRASLDLERPANESRRDHGAALFKAVGYTTLGWSDCGHDSWRSGVILDPFAGSGTTLAVAVGHGRDAIGIDIDEHNAELHQERVGMFLSVEDRRAGAA